MSKTAAERADEDALIEQIIADARKRAERAMHKAEQEAKQAIDKAQREAEELSRGVIGAAANRAEKEKAILLATIDIEAKRFEMKVKEDLIKEAFDAAERKIMDLSSPGYAAVPAKLIASAVRAVGGDVFHVALSKADRDSLKLPDLQKKVSELVGRNVTLKLDDSAAPITGGAIVRSEDGHRMVDNSLEGRLARMRDDLRRQAAQILFETKTQRG